MTLFETPELFWQATWKRTLILVILCALPMLVLAQGRNALGVVLGGLLLLADIYMLKAPLELLVRRVANRKRTWIMALGLLRIIAVAALLLLIVKFRFAGLAGLFLGVSLPIVAIVSLLVTGGLTAWKV